MAESFLDKHCTAGQIALSHLFTRYFPGNSLQVICEHPDRSYTGQKLRDLNVDLAQLKDRESKLDEKLQKRKKQFHVLVHSIHQLQELLENEREEDDAITSSQDKDHPLLDASSASSSGGGVKDEDMDVAMFEAYLSQ